jgi:hypothetical protein
LPDRLGPRDRPPKSGGSSNSPKLRQKPLQFDDSFVPTHGVDNNQHAAWHSSHLSESIPRDIQFDPHPLETCCRSFASETDITNRRRSDS